MPSSYSSYHSPSLHKMNGNLEANAGRGGLRRFSFGNALCPMGDEAGAEGF